MTGHLHVSMDSTAFAADGTVTACEVIGGPDLDVHDTGPLRVGQTSIIDVPEGVYFVRATLPSGYTFTATAEVSADEDLAVDLASSEIPLPDPPTPDHDIALWARRWELPDGEPEPLMADSVENAVGSIVLDINADNRRHCLQIGGPATAWRIVHLPLSRRATVTLTHSSADNTFGDGLDVQVASASPVANTMLGYLTTGQLDSAAIVAPELLDQARSLFASKVANPEGAALAGYFLLRVGQQDILGDWPANFANWFSDIPDSSVIHAWQLLRRPGVPDRHDARSAIAHAAKSGIPSYTEGLRLLFQGLQTFGNKEAGDDEIRSLLDQIGRYAAACDWTAPLTTYWATGPNDPTLHRTTGFPDTHESTWTRLTLHG